MEAGKSASQEYIEAIIIHEFVHGIMTNTPGPLENFINLNNRHHGSMFQISVTEMAKLLQELYPNLQNEPDTSGLGKDARALALSTLKDLYVRRFGQTAVNQKLDPIAKDKYGITMADALSIGLSYRVGNPVVGGKGTYCP